MKIALLSTFYPYRGGIAQFSAMLFRALEAENHQVEAYNFKRQYPGILFPGKTQLVTEADNADVIVSQRLLDSVNPLSFRSTAKKIKKSNPDLLISQYWMTFFGPALGGVHKRVSVDTKRISILHNVIPHEKRFFDKVSNKYFLKQNEGYVVLSDRVLEDLLSIKPDAKYLRIDHPVYSHFGETLKREDAIEKLGLNPDHKHLLFFGFIRDYKGLDLLVDAMNSLPEDYHLIVAGEVYGSFDKYQSQIDSHNLGSRIHLYNEYISDSEVPVYFSASDVCVLPYKEATQSGITAISQHFELPVIATDVGGLKEVVIHNEEGLIIKQPNSKLIAEGILHYFDNNLKEEFKPNIKQRKEENSWSNFARKIVDFSETI